MARTITVIGKGCIEVVPDTVEISITVSNKNNNYSDTISESERLKRALCDALNSCGFEDNSIKTISYDINSEYEGYEAEDKCWKQRLVGFRCNHTLAISFPMDNKRINDLLTAISINDNSPEIAIGFTVNDYKDAREAAIRLAMEEATINANIIADSSGVKLGRVSNVSYGNSGAVFVNQTSNIQLYNSRGKCMDMSFTPKDIKVEEVLTVEWEME